VLVEHARSLAGIHDASHAEYGAGGTAVITALSCSLQGREIVVDLAPDSMLARLHGSTRVIEKTTCDYGLAPNMQDLAGEHGMSVAGRDDTGEVRAIERADHPFFMGTLYQPQLTSTPERPHPLFVALVRGAASLGR
jgi:CTP synthase (UTP-ammonia lyase)